MVEDHGMGLLKQLNDRASELKKIDKQRDDMSREQQSKHRINIGLFLYHQDSEQDK